MNLKKVALEKLAARLAADAAVAAILGAGGHSVEDRIFAGYADAEDAACFPSIALDAQKFSFVPFQDEVVDHSDDEKALFEVAQLEGEVLLYVVGKSKAQRADLEQAVLDAFMQREGAPGVLVETLEDAMISGVETGFSVHFSYALEDEEWIEEKVFDARRASYLTLEVTVPVLVLRDAPTVEDLVLALTRSLDSDTPEEQSLIAEDGSISEP